jgi:hypothetical protein
VTAKPYHAYPFLSVNIPGPRYVKGLTPFYIENVVIQDPVKAGPTMSVPLKYRYRDDVNRIDRLVPILLATPFSGMRVPFDVKAFDPSQMKGQPKFAMKAGEKPKVKINLQFQRADEMRAEERAFAELNADWDDMCRKAARDNAKQWFPNTPDTVMMGSISLTRADKVEGGYRALMKERIATDENGAQVMYPPTLSFNLQQDAKGAFACDVYDTDRLTKLASPLKITQGAMVCVFHERTGLYLMHDITWGLKARVAQIVVIEWASHTPAACMMPPVPMDTESTSSGAYGWSASDEQAH